MNDSITCFDLRVVSIRRRIIIALVGNDTLCNKPYFPAPIPLFHPLLYTLLTTTVLANRSLLHSHHIMALVNVVNMVRSSLAPWNHLLRKKRTRPVSFIRAYDYSTQTRILTVPLPSYSPAGRSRQPHVLSQSLSV